MNGKTILVGLVFFLLCSVAVYFYGRHRGYENGYDKCYPVAFNAGYDSGYVAPHPADTTIKPDTAYIDKPVPVVVIPSGYELVPAGTVAELQEKLDSAKAAGGDTTEVYVPIQIERKVYEDNRYKAQVSGYRPALDWIEVYNQTQIITNYIDRPVPYDHPVPFKWTLSAFVDATASLYYFNARAGLMYDQQISGRWRGYAAAGYEYGSLGKGPFAQVGTKFNILQK